MTSAKEENKKLHIVILGAGLVGAFAAVLLSKLANVEVIVYEKSSGPRESGAAITFTESSLVTLSKVFDIDDLQSILYRSPKYRGVTTRHWKTGDYLRAQTITPSSDLRFSPAKSQRIQLHDYILKHVPGGTIKYGYETTGVDLNPDGDSTGKIKVNFKNKDSVISDLVVAADGIYSRTRRQFTGDHVVYKGSVAYRNVFDESLVAHIPNLPHDFTVWIGKDSSMFMTKLKPNKFNVAAHLHEPPEVAKTLKWNDTRGEWEKNRLIEHFKDWDPLIGEILKVMPESYAFPLERAPWLKDLAIADRLAFVGDAAHPTSGVYGAGAGLGFDDVWALYRGISEVAEKVSDADSFPQYDLRKSLLLFNETRKYFLQKVVEQMDVDAAVISQYVATAKDDEQWRERLNKRAFQASWITQHNVELEFQQVRDKHFLEIVKDK